MAKKAKGGAAEEWVGGIVSSPSYVLGDGQPFRPEVLLWMIPRGPIVGMTIMKPGTALDNAARSFHDTTRYPTVGPAHVPARLRVATVELAEVLTGAVGPDTEVVRAPTPELEEAHAMLGVWLAANPDGSPPEESYLSGGASAAAVEAMFEATAALYRAKPWTVVPDDTCLLLITSEALGLRDAAVVVVGQDGDAYGAVVFPSVQALERFARIRFPEEAPAHLQINFEPASRISPLAMREIERHDWEIAGPAAHPWVCATDDDGVVRPLLPRDATTAEAVSRAIVQLLESDPKLAEVFETRSLDRTLTVDTHTGPVKITVRSARREGAPDADDAGGGESAAEKARSFILAGLQAGYDMTTQEGVEAWTRVSGTGARQQAKPARKTSKKKSR